MLAYLLPNDAQLFATLAEEAAMSRLLAGVQYRSDVTAGLELGRAVAAQVIEWAAGRRDGCDAGPGHVPSGPGYWQGEPLAEPLAGTWKTWALSTGSQFRPGPPPAYDSERMAAEVDELKRHDRTANLNRRDALLGPRPVRAARADAQIATNQAAFHWAPLNSLLWEAELNQKLFEYRLDANPPRAARAYALAERGWLRRGGRLLGRQVRLLGAAPDPLRPDGHAALHDTAAPELPVRPLDGRGGNARRCWSISSRATRSLQAERGGDGSLADVGRNPLPERQRDRPGARAIRRAGGDRTGDGRRFPIADRGRA